MKNHCVVGTGMMVDAVSEVSKSGEDPIGSAHSKTKSQIVGTFFLVGLFLIIFLIILWFIEIGNFNGGPEDWLEEMNYSGELKMASAYFGGMAVIAALVIPVSIQAHASMDKVQQGLFLGGEGGNGGDGRKGGSAKKFTEEERGMIEAAEGRFLHSSAINFAASIGVVFLYGREISKALNEINFWAIADTYMLAVLFLFIIWLSFFVENDSMKKYNHARKELTNDWAHYLDSAWARFMAYRLVDEQRKVVWGALPLGERCKGNYFLWAFLGALVVAFLGVLTLGKLETAIFADLSNVIYIFIILSMFIFIFLFVTLICILRIVKVFKVAALMAPGKNKISRKKNGWSWVPAESKVEVICGMSITIFLFLLISAATYFSGTSSAVKWLGGAGIILCLLIIAVFGLLNCGVERRVGDKLVCSAKEVIYNKSIKSSKCPYCKNILKSGFFKDERKNILGRFPLSEEAEFLIISLR